MLERAWDRFDDDGGGTLGIREIRMLLKSVGRDVTDAQFGIGLGPPGAVKRP